MGSIVNFFASGSIQSAETFGTNILRNFPIDVALSSRERYLLENGIRASCMSKVTGVCLRGRFISSTYIGWKFIEADDLIHRKARDINDELSDLNAILCAGGEHIRPVLELAHLTSSVAIRGNVKLVPAIVRNWEDRYRKI